MYFIFKSTLIAISDAFTDAAIGSRLNGDHKDKDLEPWDGGDSTNEDLEALESDVVNIYLYNLFR